MNVNLQKNIYRPTWKLESDKKIGSRVVRGRRKRRRGIEENVRECDGQDGGRTDMRARKKIS